MRLNLRVALLLLIALVAIGGAWSASQPPPSDRDLGNSSGAQKSVTLVIDFGKQSGRDLKVLKLEQLTSEANGWDVLIQSGTKVQGTSQYPTGFVCRLDGWPVESEQTCQDTPAFSEGHWAYYVTSKSVGEGWILSGQGAAAHIPECGASEGWKWVGPGENATPPSAMPVIGTC